MHVYEIYICEMRVQLYANVGIVEKLLLAQEESSVSFHVHKLMKWIFAKWVSSYLPLRSIIRPIMYLFIVLKFLSGLLTFSTIIYAGLFFRDPCAGTSSTSRWKQTSVGLTAAMRWKSCGLFFFCGYRDIYLTAFQGFCSLSFHGIILNFLQKFIDDKDNHFNDLLEVAVWNSRD